MVISLSKGFNLTAAPYGFVGRDGRRLTWSVGGRMRRRDKRSVRSALIDDSWSKHGSLQAAFEEYLYALIPTDINSSATYGAVQAFIIQFDTPLRIVRAPPKRKWDKAADRPIEFYQRYAQSKTVLDRVSSGRR